MVMHLLMKKRMENLRCLTIPKNFQVTRSRSTEATRRSTILLMTGLNIVEAKIVKADQARLTATKGATALHATTLVLMVHIVRRHLRHHLTMAHQDTIMMTHHGAALRAKATSHVPLLQARIIVDLLAGVLPLNIKDLHVNGLNTTMSIVMRTRMITSTMGHRHMEFSVRSMVHTTIILNITNSLCHRLATGFIDSVICCAIPSGAMYRLLPRKYLSLSNPR